MNETDNQADLATQNAEKTHAAIYGKITSNKHNYFGLFVVIIKLKERFFERTSVAFSIYSEIHNITLQDGWNVFERNIEDLKYGGNYAESISMDLNSALMFEGRKIEFVNDLIENIGRTNVVSIKELLLNLFQKSLIDSNVELYLSLTMLNEAELAGGRKREENGDNAEQESDPSKELKLVNVKLILAPVGGKLVTELTKGDKILVTIPPLGSRDNYYIDSWQLRKPEGGFKSVVATVVAVKDKGNATQITVYFKDDVYGLVVEEEKVLVRMFNPAKDQDKLLTKPEETLPKSFDEPRQNNREAQAASKNGSAKSDKKEKKSSSLLPLIGSVGAALIIGLTITYFFVAQ